MSNKNSQPPKLNSTPVMSLPPKLNTTTISSNTPRNCRAGLIMETSPKTRMAFDSLPKDLKGKSD